MTTEKLKVEIWSDVMCPFCYIGKRRFENALNQFENKGDIEVLWKSFDLYPNLETNKNIDIKDFLIDNKGITEAQAEQLMTSAASLASDAKLNFEWEKVVVANTKKSHELIHLAEKKGLQNEMKERLFKAYFEEGENVDDLETLFRLGAEVGIEKETIKLALSNDRFTPAINFDIQEARQIGVSGVPFFVLNRKFAVSGAQSETYFSQALATAYFDWKNPEEAAELRKQQQEQQNSCTPGGGCC